MASLRSLRIVTVLAALGLASCAELPQQGFATRYLGGSFGPTLGEQFDTATDFSGQPLSDSAAANRPRPSDVCEATAQDRSRDIAVEGYDGTLQKKVYDAVLADCRAWRPRH